MPRDPEDMDTSDETTGNGAGDAPGVGAEAETTPAAGSEGLEAQLAVARQSADDFKDRLYRKAAELENTKRRLTKQLEDARRYAGDEVLKELLPVVDDLQRALDHAARTADERGAANDDPVRVFTEGMNLVLRKLLSAMGKFGVQPFDAVGQPFDPQVHEAISQVESADHPPGTVVSEFLKGYKQADRLLRPAVVTVSRAPIPPPESSE